MSLSKMNQQRPRVVATSVYDWEKYTMMYFLKGSLAGGICCSLTHGALTPVDVVKTRIQLEPEVYNKGMVGGFKQVIEAEGTGALLTGLAPTAVGYFIQGGLFGLHLCRHKKEEESCAASLFRLTRRNNPTRKCVTITFQDGSHTFVRIFTTPFFWV